MYGVGGERDECPAFAARSVKEPREVTDRARYSTQIGCNQHFRVAAVEFGECVEVVMRPGLLHPLR